LPYTLRVWLALLGQKSAQNYPSQCHRDAGLQ